MKNKLRQFEHVKRRHIYSIVKRVDQMEESQITRGRERPKKTITEIIKKYLKIIDLTKSMILNKVLLQKLIYSLLHLMDKVWLLLIMNELLI